MTVSEAVARRISNLLKERNMTQYRLEKNSNIQHGTMQCIMNGRNKTTAQWERGHHKMLVLDGRKYLLFPKNLISDSKYYCKDEYLRMYVLTYLQQENIDNDTHLVRKTYNKDGSLRTVRVFKKDIIKDKESHGEFLTKNWLARFTKDLILKRNMVR